MGEWTIAVIDVEEALPPALLATIPKPAASLSVADKDPAPKVPVSEPNGGNRTLFSSLIADKPEVPDPSVGNRTLPTSLVADTEPKHPDSNPAPEVPVSELPTVWTVATKTESSAAESRPENAPEPKPASPAQPRRRYFSDLFAKISAINTLGRSTRPKPADPEETRLHSESLEPVIEPLEPAIQYTTVQQSAMADDNAQLQVHPEPVEIHREAEVKSSVAPASDTEQDSGTYDGVDNASLSSDNTTNSDLYTDTEDQPEQEPESVYEEVNPTEAGNSQAAPGTEKEDQPKKLEFRASI
ncbi:hypothetical protein Bbelb_245350 [Branchiostoma belcheri]|nr:hypothetical protein Bbelb_245350 [Branchiostoma belcheri]